MRRFLLAWIALGLALGATPALADGGDATHFIVKVLKVELKDSTGNWITLAEPKADVDLMTDEPILLMTNDGRVPAGKYQHVRITLSETFKFSGSDGANKTKEGGSITVGGTAYTAADMPRNEIKTFRQDAPTWNKEAEGLVTERLDFDYEDRDDITEIYNKFPFAKSLIVKEKSTIKVSLGLDLKRSVHYAWPDYFSGISSREAMYLLPPKDVSEVTVKTESSTALTTAEAIEWAF